MSTWRVVLCGDHSAYLVHVTSESEAAARVAAAKKIKRELGASGLRARSAERISA